ncbi:MAG: beta-lactamase family protein, partial [Deltaproteobacteria bacterium]|nr:beta-lactamase family protein [Deltaproteobacteria bacterium]
MTHRYSDPEFEQSIATLAKNAIKDEVFPGIEILCARGDGILFHRAYGRMDRHLDSQALQTDSLFDLASLTKPLATAAAILHLSDNGLVELETPASLFIREFEATEKANISISQLLTHTAGFPDWTALYEPDFDRDSAWEKIIHVPLVYNPGSGFIYSCLGYIVLGEIVRRISQMTLADYCQTRIYKPLGLDNLLFNPDPERINIVPTADCPLRKKRLRGQVHDENAFTFDGEGGNAGLFGTASAIYTYCRMLLSSGKLNDKQIFSVAAVEGFLNNQNPSWLAPRTFGWDVNDGSETYMSCGNLMPTGSIGHLGFTGTSIWMDPVSQFVIILLSNRVNLTRDKNIPL